MSSNSSAAGGFTLGTIIAVVLSWKVNASIGYAIVHGILSWGYVIYYVVEKSHVSSYI